MFDVIAIMDVTCVFGQTLVINTRITRTARWHRISCTSDSTIILSDKRANDNCNN